ncbi:MAG: 4a-hydroxytetrahydrobiopterin dehydratase [Mycobacteriaceae bacterium]|nr:4a-hydroxytetrahydrobiopterin dehydratase [Mycobacteriaceae bacterium]
MTRTQASAAVELIGWRLLFGCLAASVPVPSMHRGLEVAALAGAACADDADDHLRIDVRSDHVEMVLQTKASGNVTQRDVELAHRIADAIRDARLSIVTPLTQADAPTMRPVQSIELGIDALDIAAIRPFWKAVLAYVDEPGTDEPNVIVDPLSQGPAVWFQQMNAPRPQRNRIHFDVTVSHEEAPRRIQAALDAGGILLSDAAARSWWVLADAEGNEICVCTWQDRDPT